MKKVLILIIMTVILIGTGVYTAFANTHKEVFMKDKKVLIAYYSYSGNTKSVAEKIKNLTGGELFEIQPKTPYSKDYNTVVNQAQKEKQENFKPELVDNGNVANYDVIFVGTPVWWYTMASPVRTFLSENNFEGKIIVPFCTHGGGGASSTYTDIKKLAPKAEVVEGFTSYGNSATKTDIENFYGKIFK